MKIAIVAQQATPLRPAEAASPRPDDAGLADLTRSLARHGHQVTLYTQQPPAPGEPSVADLGDGIRVEHIPGQPGLAGLAAFAGPLHDRWQHQRPDVVHAAGWTSGLAALAATRDLRIPVIQSFSTLGITDHRDHPAARPASPGSPVGPVGPDSLVEADAGRARLRLEPAIGRGATAVLAASSAIATDLARLGVPRTAVRCVPWGVDTDMFTPEGPAAPRNGRPRLLTAADLTEREPLETLLRALTKVPAAELMIVGGPGRDRLVRDPAYKHLAALAGTLDLNDRVIFTGQVARHDMPALLRSADLVLSTCAYEPSGITSLEAMACGKPVLAPPTGGHVDAVVDGTTGLIIPPGRPALLAQRIRHLLAHPILLEAYGVAAADRARSRYTWARIADETLTIYDHTLQTAA